MVFYWSIAIQTNLSLVDSDEFSDHETFQAGSDTHEWKGGLTNMDLGSKVGEC